MKLHTTIRRFGCVLPATGLMLSLAASGPWAFAADDGSSGSSKEDTIVLSPFTVSTEKDSGYKATNATSGTRLDTPIQDLPLPINVITGAFIRDTGSENLRDVLRYSAGIQVQNQNDYGLSNAYGNPGGVNNPAGHTADKSDSVYVMRGFETDNTLRDGFRRRTSTDSVNIDRIEVVYGPAALLYGIGNFGGVVNYMVKTPLDHPAYDARLTLGSWAKQRFEFDATGPVAKNTPIGSFNYRLTASTQKNGNFTDFYDNKKFFISPVITWQPTKTTQVTIDTEYGEQRQHGIGFQSLRARADITASNAANQQDRYERAGFLLFPGQNLRSMRWSGPDTFQKTIAGNFEAKVTQQILPDLHLLAAYNHSTATFRTRDIDASVTNSVGPAALQATVTPVVLDPLVGDTEQGFGTSTPVPFSIVQYQWKDSLEGVRTDQARVELNYKLDLFSHRKWLEMDNSFLAGWSMEQDKDSTTLNQLDPQNLVYDYKSPADPTPFRFGVQGDGTADKPLRLHSYNYSDAKEEGWYGIYQGQFLNKMITVLGGVRRDINSLDTIANTYSYADGSVTASNIGHNPDSRKDTSQIGVSVSPVHGLSIFALRSQGIQPNFGGAIDPTGKPLGPITALNREYGLKFDLFHGRVSGRISHYKITREGVPSGAFWWQPQTAFHVFDPNKDVVYDASNFNPEYYRAGGNGGAFDNNYAWYGDLSKYSNSPFGAADNNVFNGYKNDGLNNERQNIVSLWDAAVGAGAVKYYDTNNNAVTQSAWDAAVKSSPAGSHPVTVDATNPAGAAYMDAVFQYTKDNYAKHPGTDDWPGWLYGGGPGVNNAGQDRVANAASGITMSNPQSDRNTGWDAELLLRPTDQWQVMFTINHNHHEIISLGRFPYYPNYDKDRWATWLFPNGQWGLFGVYDKNKQYSNEADSSTFSYNGLIYPGAEGQDFPTWSWNALTTYSFDKVPTLKGLMVGFSAQYLGNREYNSGYTHGGNAWKDQHGNPIIQYTPKQYTYGFFARYEFKYNAMKPYVQVNIDNLLDDRSRYGLLYAPGRSVSVELGTSF